MAFFGHAATTGVMDSRNIAGGRRCSRMQYIDNINIWTRASSQENIRMADGRTAWRKRSCTAGVDIVRTEETEKVSK